MLGGAVMSFPVTASAALGSSGFAGKKEEWRLQCEPFLLVWLAGQFFSLLFISITRGNRTEMVTGWLFWGKYPQTRTPMGRTSSLLQDEANKCSSRCHQHPIARLVELPKGTSWLSKTSKLSHPSVLLHFGTKLCHLPAQSAEPWDAHPPSPAVQTEPSVPLPTTRRGIVCSRRTAAQQPQQRDIVFCISAKSMILFLFSRSETAQRFHKALVCS